MIKYMNLFWRHACAAGLLLPALALAQPFPSKPIRFYISSAPGGPIDLLARPVAQKLSEATGQSVVVDFKPGADGVIGTDYVAKSAPDGHTLLVVGTALTINPSIKKSLPYDTLRDFTLISLMASADSVLVVHPRVKANNVAELIALAKTQPGRLNYGSTGATSRLGMELFLMMAGINIAHIPYKGAGPAIVDLVGGQIDVMWTSLPPSQPHIKAGKMRLLAVGGLKRSKSVPDTPTVAETLSGFENTSQYGLIAPSATPMPVINLLNAHLQKIVALPDVRETFAKAGFEPKWQNTEEAAAWLRSETAKWAAVVKAAKIQPE
jgi:tripartite-type tricarboxylate transporter receptor subunit TctC